MRTGGYSVQQALTAESAAVLKLSVALANRRGHAQVTPLHVAATLLSSSSPSQSSSISLLRRACLRSHPTNNRHLSSSSTSSFHCRALELCFNVALNRLPSAPPSTTSPFAAACPSLSNALVAALKRAQAHQRRGCIELHHHHHHHHHQHQPPLLAVKVELEQLIISILDDPSVSRVMREAGFSSTTVKNNLEEQHSSSIFETTQINNRDFSSLSSYLHQTSNKLEDDLKMVLDVMLRSSTQGKRCNVVIIGDSISCTDGLVGELAGKVDRGEVPEELKHSQFVKIQLSSLTLKFMRRDEIEAKIFDLTARIRSLAGKKVILYVGDLKWAAEEDNEVEYLITEISKMLAELRGLCGGAAIGDGGGGGEGKVWLMATASYQTYMRCQMRYPQLENQWGLQAVAVPSAGLGLSLHSSSGLDSRGAKFAHYSFNFKDDQEKLTMCAECNLNYEKEASNESKDINKCSSNLPSWLQPPRPDNYHKENLIELKKKWSRLCQRIHHRHFEDKIYKFFPSSWNPWLLSSSIYNQNKSCTELEASKKWLTEVNFKSPRKFDNEEVKTTLALGTSLFSDSATSKGQEKGISPEDRKMLNSLLEKNIPWQSETISSIVDAFCDSRSPEKGIWLTLQGTDEIAKKRVAKVAAEFLCGSLNRLVRINSKKSATFGSENFAEFLKNNPKCVFFIEFIDQAATEFRNFLAAFLENGFTKDSMGEKISLAQSIFILTTSSSSSNIRNWDENVLNLKFVVEDFSPNLKRKLEFDSPDQESKKPRTVDLNICLEEDENEVPSDLTQDNEAQSCNFSCDFLKLMGASITMDLDENKSRRMAEFLSEKFSRAFEEARGGREENRETLDIDRTVVDELIGSSGSFSEGQFEDWLREVFQTTLTTVKKGGKMKLTVDGGGKNGNSQEFGFHGTILPNNIRIG